MVRFTCSIDPHIARERFRLTNFDTGEVIEGDFAPLIQALTRNSTSCLGPHDVWELRRVIK